MAAVYVDDVILTGDNVHAKFGIKDLGDLHYFLGIEVTHIPQGLLLCQQKFAKELLAESGMDFSVSTCTPLPVHVKLSNTEGDLIPNPELYRSIVGKFNYLTNTRPDLSYTVQTLSQFMHAPRTSHLAALHHAIRYLTGTVTQ